MARPVFDAVSESHAGTTGSTSEASFTFSHNPVGTPRGVLVFTFTNAFADDATAVTYDGVALTAVPGGRAALSSAEPGDCKAWFLGSSIPTTDPANVVVTRNNNANVMYAICVTVTATADTEIVGTPVIHEAIQAPAEAAVDSSAADALRFAGINYGGPSLAPAGASSTAMLGIDFGPRTINSVRETTGGTGSRSVGFAAGSDDDIAVHLAVAEAAAGFTGTVAVTQANQTSTASGTVTPPPVTGTVAVTQAAQTSTASGQLGYSGTVAATQADQTSNAAGQLGYTGTVAVTQADQTSTASGTVTGGGATFPDAPINVTAVAQSDTEILVSWDAVTDADAYDVERDSVIVADKIATLNFSDTGLSPSTEYSYRVRAARIP